MPFTPISIIILEGVNYKICQKLEMNNTKFLVSKEEGTFGMGMVGELNKELSEIEFFNF
jgi:hypothetical protein